MNHHLFRCPNLNAKAAELIFKASIATFYGCSLVVASRSMRCHWEGFYTARISVINWNIAYFSALFPDLSGILDRSNLAGRLLFFGFEFLSLFSRFTVHASSA
jgi:hypothetical protein